ncbi:MAG: ATP-binding protein [candidate division KSB1 bacterium]|nr:ATP-binding protein [candidate division KSB1 bacterium]MDZ7300638.1 ATP-binding protein [candidate division KSB1 bacterium]MDZ7309775.1 ATP-binding protein [candidate division KSB1 bacterium]
MMVSETMIPAVFSTGATTTITDHTPKPRLLLVNSRNDWSMRLHDFLHESGVELEVLSSAQTALDFLQARFCSALLLEIPLPDMPAPQMVTIARNRFPYLPIIVMAEESSLAEALSALNAGAFHFIPSHFEPKQVLSTLRKTIALQNEPVTLARALPELKQTIRFSLPSGLDNITGAAAYLTETLVRFGIISIEEINIRIALVEALTNAMEHGNGFDPNKSVKVEANFFALKAEIKITDEGKGFNHRKLPNPTAPENLYKPRGRGIYMMYRLMDEVHFNRKGNSVRLVKYRKSR